MTDKEKALLWLATIYENNKDKPKAERATNGTGDIDYTFPEFDDLCKNIIKTQGIMQDELLKMQENGKLKDRDID